MSVLTFKKRIVLTLLVLFTVLIVSACASDDGASSNDTSDNQNEAQNNEEPANDNSSSNEAPDDGEKIELNVFQFKAAISEQMEDMEAAYEKEHPNVELTIDTVGGGADWMANLKTRFASGEGPDVFVVEGPAQLKLWEDYLTDLSNEEWVDHSLPFAKEKMMMDDKLYGMPMNIEGFGFIYNKDLFEEAGITELPTTQTELEEVVAKLNDAGITPFANGFATWWAIGLHLPNVAFAQQDDPMKFIEQLSAGEATMAGNEQFEEFQDLLDFMLENGTPNPLSTDLNTQLTLFASGEAAMVHQGNWTEPTIYGINPDINLGLLPVPLNDNAEEMDKIQVGVPFSWVINNETEHMDEAKEFLNWMAMSETGHKYITEDFMMIPAFDHIDASGLGDVSQVINKYSKEDKTLDWIFPSWPDGFGDQTSNLLQGYIGDQHDFDTVLEEMDKAWQESK
ncbi:ABC transporter substrate-binding protein [Radiobacillus sp. PE A8.2]|uniref:ABC transporter substrate-binding protein n=1 Tax=Radiobacillus sp. PE A8.2 TaxID=3380349 RepID=UPI00388F8519